MMRTKYLLSVIALFFSAVAFANTDYRDWWKRANEHYGKSEYERALYFYQMVAKLEPRDANVYYNIGNTYYRLNDIGHAVLYYERALHLQPSHTQAADNLYLTQNRINNRIQEMPEIFFVRWWKSITQSGLTNVYSVIALALLLLLVVYYSALKLGKITYKAPGQLSAGITVLSVIFIVLALSAGNRSANPGIAVIMTEGTPMMAEPKYGKSLSLIPEGTTVQITETATGWYEIVLPDGRTGWVQQASIEKVWDPLESTCRHASLSIL